MFTEAQVLALAEVLDGAAFNLRRIVAPVPAPAPEIDGFAGYPVADLPPLPEGWTDTTWRNEGAPTYRCGLANVWIDYADPARRFDVVECDQSARQRFIVTRMDFDDVNGTPAALLKPEGEELFASDDWAEVVAFVGDREAARRARAVRMVALTRNLHRAVSALYAEYDRHEELNAEQPDCSDVYAASLDEWALACASAVERWQARAGV